MLYWSEINIQIQLCQFIIILLPNLSLNLTMCFWILCFVLSLSFVILWAISRREISPLVVILKKIDQTSWRTTRHNYKHIPQIVCISSRFRVLHLLSWEFERSEVLWRYTDILVCHLKQVEVGWSTRNYPHTGHLSWTWTLSRWRDAVFLSELSIDRPKEDEKLTFLDISADFRAF